MYLGTAQLAQQIKNGASPIFSFQPIWNGAISNERK